MQAYSISNSRCFTVLDTYTDFRRLSTIYPSNSVSITGAVTRDSAPYGQEAVAQEDVPA